MHLQKFTRTNFNVQDNPEEVVWVVVEIDAELSDENIEEYDRKAWDALWEQYPIWSCPYNQSNPPPNAKEKLRHGWSSAFMEPDRIRL
jgi:hypothetical protein